MTEAEYVQGLRDFADWIERHPEIDGKIDPTSRRILIHSSDREKLLENLLLLEGQGVAERDRQWLQVVRKFGPCEVQVYIDADKVGDITTRREEVEVSDWEPHPELRPILDAFQQVPA